MDISSLQGVRSLLSFFYFELIHVHVQEVPEWRQRQCVIVEMARCASGVALA